LVVAKFENDSPQKAENVQLPASVAGILTFWTTQRAKVMSEWKN